MEQSIYDKENNKKILKNWKGFPKKNNAVFINAFFYVFYCIILVDHKYNKQNPSLAFLPKKHEPNRP